MLIKINFYLIAYRISQCCPLGRPPTRAAEWRRQVTIDGCQMKQSPRITGSTSRIWLTGPLPIARTPRWAE